MNVVKTTKIGSAAMQLSSDVSARIDAYIATGQFTNQDEVMRAALTALEEQREDWAAIQAGIADMEAGRFRPFAAADADLRKKHNIPRNQ
jgi:Arc/MetJ-type ribon-helix-helix transcriptional regulator